MDKNKKAKTIGILTFHFAYNYGAMLQAYALKEYLSKEHDVKIINYQPQKTEAIYSTNPFAYGFHPKLIFQRIKEWPLKKRQAKKFEFFKREYLDIKDKPFYSLDKLQKILKQNEVNVFGSDQIWNLDITGENGEYYGEFCDNEKINVVYAGSFGHDALTDKEKDFISFMNAFDMISVRESYAKEVLEREGIIAQHVCDPVFLMDVDKWKHIAQKPKGLKEEKFILYYTLREDNDLISNVRNNAETLNLIIYSIHPNANNISVGKQLFGIGPLEFLWLIQNAEYVYTNSFHASAFSLLFKKKLIQSEFEKGKSRVQSLLDIVSAKKSIDNKGVECLDLSKIDNQKLIEYINESKVFLGEINEKQKNS